MKYFYITNFCLTLLIATAGVALEGATVPMVEVSPTPTPTQVRAAKQAFDAGDIVVMKGGTIAGFEGLLNIAMPQSDSRHRQPPPCVQAARKMPSGRVRKFLHRSRPFAANNEVECQNSLEKWSERQEDVGDINSQYWTAVEDLSLASGWISSNGNSISMDLSVYRANTIDPKFDYYLSLCSITGNADAKYELASMSLDSSAAYSNGLTAGYVGYGPLINSNTIAVGQSIPFDQNASGTYTDSVSVAPEDVLVLSGGELEWQFQNLASSSSSVQTAVIYEVPTGTSHLTIAISPRAAFAWPIDLVNNNRTSVLIPISAPQVLMPELTFAMEGAKSSFDVTASPYLQTGIAALPEWMPQASVQFTDPNGVVSQAPPTGSSSFTVSFTVPADPECLTNQTCVNPGNFVLQTSPAYAAIQTKLPPVSSSTIELVPDSPAAGVLIAGGQDWSGNILQTADIWDSTTGSTTLLASQMVQARYQHTATLIAPSSTCQQANAHCVTTGQVLIAGGLGTSGQALSSTEFFDPSTSQFSAGPSMTSAHAGAVALQLQDGRILIIGGLDQSGTATSVVDIYDPLTNRFSSTPMHLTMPRWNFAANVLQDGSVLVQGGSDGPNQNDGPATGTAEKLDNCGSGFYPLTNGLVVGRLALAATVLKNGQVFSVGGYNGDVDGGDALSETELFTPNSGSFSQVMPLPEGGVQWASAILQEDGNVAVIGGLSTPNRLSIFDPASLSFVGASSMTEERDVPTAVRLEGIGTADKGKILVAGGVYPNTGTNNGELVELYDPTAQSWASAGMLSASRRHNTTTLFGKYAGSLPATFGCN